MAGTALMLDVQKFLRGFKSISMGNTFLRSKFEVNIEQDFLMLGDGSMEPVWLYNHTDRSRGNIRLENECRGLILNAAVDVVSMGFSRLFEHDHPHASEIDWSCANIEHLYDGTLVAVYSYDGNYFIQTLTNVNAENKLRRDSETSYYDAVIRILKSWSEDGDPFGIFRKHNERDKYVWAFEYISPDNNNISPYDYTDLVLLAAFNKELPKGEIAPEYVDQFANEHDITRPVFRRASGPTVAQYAVDTLNPLERGLVVVDHLNRRVKMINPAYKVVEKILNLPSSALRPRHFAELVLKGDAEEVATYFPQYAEILNFFSEVVYNLLEEIQNIWLLYRIADERQVFAAEVSKHPFSHLLFMAWDGKIKDMTDALKHIKPNQLVELATQYHPTDLERAMETAVHSGLHGNGEESEVGTEEEDNNRYVSQ